MVLTHLFQCCVLILINLKSVHHNHTAKCGTVATDANAQLAAELVLKMSVNVIWIMDMSSGE